MEKCASCIYRTDIGIHGKKHHTCYYIAITGKMRGCDPEDCIRYQEGPSICDNPRMKKINVATFKARQRKLKAKKKSA